MFGIGFTEELSFRGAGLITLGEAIGFWPAAIVISAIFAAVHYFGKGPVENLADAVSVGLLGLFMSFTVLRTGSIWFAVGFHALFDYAALYIFGEPNSGNRGGTPIDTRFLTGTFHGPSWLTGGPLGVERSWLVSRRPALPDLRPNPLSGARVRAGRRIQSHRFPVVTPLK
jgi:hypothetical protein